MKLIFHMVFQILLLNWSGLALAAVDSNLRLQKAGNDITDIDSLRRGAAFFARNCQTCHSMEYLRYSRIQADLEWDDETLRDQMSYQGSLFDTVASPLTEEQGIASYGIAPPDLSLRSRVRGSDWVFTFLKSFYQREDGGFDNAVFPGTAMPFLMVGIQGIQKPLYREVHGVPQLVDFNLTSAGSMNKKEFHYAMRDLTNFLEYAGEPAKMQRVQLGWKVMLFLLVLTLLLWLVKREYWRDIRKESSRVE